MSRFDALLAEAEATEALLAPLESEREYEEHALFLPSPMGVLPVVSDRAVRLIIACEVNNQAAYERSYRRPIWPQGASGVTIGIGYDVGYVATTELRQDWAGLILDSSLSQLATARGVTGRAAQALLPELRGVDVPWGAARSVFERATLRRVVAALARALPRAVELSPDCAGALASLVYNRGADFTSLSDRRIEMRAIHDAVAAGRFAEVPEQIRSMKRLWQGVPGMAGVVARRELEARLFEEGLLETGPAVS